MSASDLEHKFDAAMMQLYLDAKAAGYNATYFLRMLNDSGGVASAKQLVRTDAPSEGFVRLWEMKRLDLTVERLVTEPRYRPLFSPQEVLRAKQRLERYGG